MFITELFGYSDSKKLVAVFRKGPSLSSPNSPASKIYVWKNTDAAESYEMEVGQDRKRIPVTLSFDRIKEVLAQKGFTESVPTSEATINEENTAYHRVSVTVSDPNHPAVTQRKEKVQKTIRVKGDEAGAVQKAIAHYKKKGFKVHDANYIEGYDIASDVSEASMTKSIPSKKESVFNKGVENLIGRQVAIVTHEYPDMVAYGTFKRIGETGLCHVKLNGGKLKGWAAGDMIAVAPSELYAPWDTRLQGMTAVHREYGDNGEKIVREGRGIPGNSSWVASVAKAKASGEKDPGMLYNMFQNIPKRHFYRFATEVGADFSDDPQFEKELIKAASVGAAKGLKQDRNATNYDQSAGISKDEETKFHKKLDTLVHNTFGKRKEE